MTKKQKDIGVGAVDAGTQGARHNAAGGEILDDRPVSVPLRFRGRAVTTYQEAMSLLSMVSRIAEQDGHESEEEANDFDVGDDDFEGTGSSVYTEQDEQEVLRVHKALLEERRRRNLPKEKDPAAPPQSKPDVKEEKETPE